MKKALTLDTLKDLDLGVTEEVFLHEMQAATKDCMDRPMDKKARKVILTFELTPQMDSRGDCSSVWTQCKIRSRHPEYVTRVHECKPIHGGHLQFETESPEDYNQRSLGEEYSRDADQHGGHKDNE